MIKEKATRALRDFKLMYQSALQESRFEIPDEALALGIEANTLYKYLKLDEDRNLPAGFIPNSIFREALMEDLADRCGGTFVAIHGRLHASDQAELCGIIRACSELVKEKDPKVRERLFRTIEKNAVKAVAEDQEVAK